MNTKPTNKSLGIATPVDIMKRMAAAADMASEQKLPSNAPSQPADAEGAAAPEGKGTVTHLRREKEPAKEKKAAGPAPTNRIPFDAPDYLKRELKKDAAEEDTSVKYILMCALKDYGYTIREADMKEDGRGAHK